MTPKEVKAYNQQVSDRLKQTNYLPTLVFIQVTEKCNLRCIMCGHKYWKSHKGEMSLNLFKHVVDDCVSQGIPSINIASGQGEPFLNRQIFLMLEYAKKRDLTVLTSTNGNVLTQDTINRLADLDLDHIQYSFGGFNKDSYESIYIGGNFNLALNNLLRLKVSLEQKKARTRLVANGTYPPEARSVAVKTRALLKEHGFEDNDILTVLPCNFGGLMPHGDYQQRLKNNSVKDLKNAVLKICPVLVDSPGVYWDGEVTACGCTDVTRALKIGDIRKNSLKGIRNSEYFKMLIDKFAKGNIGDIPLCKSCDVPYGESNVSSI